MSTGGAADGGGTGRGGARRGGRPRSAAADAAIAEGVIRLLREGAPAGELSMERIARAAGVGKATLYRRWPDRDALLLDAVRTLHEPLPAPAGLSVREDLVALLAFLARGGADERSGALARGVLSGLESRPQVWQAYREAVLERRRAALCAVLRRGVATGEIRTDADLLLLADLLTGPVLARTLLGEDGTDLADLPRRVVDLVLEGARPLPG